MRLLPPPKGFTPDERDVWNAAQRQLRAQGTWTGKSDVPLLEAYCKNAVQAREARQAISEYHETLYTSSNTDRQLLKDQLKVAVDAEAAAHKFATSLLLTPESRKRHGVKPVEADEDELARLVA
jgi:P27 family predicted phage terminase small subunit